MSRARGSALAWLLVGLAGVLVAAGVTVAASRIAGQAVGLRTSEQELHQLVPRFAVRPRTTPRRPATVTVTTPTVTTTAPARTTPAPPTASTPAPATTYTTPAPATTSTPAPSTPRPSAPRRSGGEDRHRERGDD